MSSLSLGVGVVDVAKVQKWYDAYIEAFSSHDAKRISGFFTYPCVLFGTRLVTTREEMTGVFQRMGDRLRSKDNFSHSVMTPVRVEQLGKPDTFLLTTSGKRFRKDGSVLEDIPTVTYICAEVGGDTAMRDGGEYRMLVMPIIGGKELTRNTPAGKL